MMSMISGLPSSLVFALPEGGQIVAGQGSIHQHTPQELHIHQDTGNLIINWQGFNIGGSESVQFIQPGIDSVVLNRVVGVDPSLILGRLSANGQIFISNPSGVIFGPGSQVNVHGLLATTLGISDTDFLNKNYNFSQDPVKGLASVLNEGAINASYAGFLAPSVINRGTIVANLGSVALASGKAATLDFIGDDLINFTITEEVTGTATDAAGNILDHNINNEGLIRADGGQVTLSVRRAGEIIKSVVNQEGVIEARTVVERGGRIFLFGGDNGIVSVAGTLDASGGDSGEKGGTIHVTGEKAGLFETAKLDASGDFGGGEILIGGDRQGQGDLPNAEATFVGANVSVNADAITQGDGGKVIVFAEDSSKIFGSLSARGGSLSGNGGFIETSGKQYLEISKTPEFGAPNGLGGEWLIDPYDLEIVSGNSASGVSSASPFDSFGSVATLGVDLISDALTSGDVTITTGTTGPDQGIITWNAALNFTGSANSSLSVTADNTITLNENITTQGSITVKAPTINLNTANILSNNNAITVTTDDFSSSDSFQTSTVNSGLASTTLLPFTTANGLDIGTGPGILGSTIDPPDNFLTASTLIFGDSSTGPITVDNIQILFIDVIINSGSTVTFTGTASTFKKLTINATGGFTNTNGSIFNNAIVSLQNSTAFDQGTNVGSYAADFLETGSAEGGC